MTLGELFEVLNKELVVFIGESRGIGKGLFIGKIRKAEAIETKYIVKFNTIDNGYNSVVSNKIVFDEIKEKEGIGDDLC